MFKTPYKVKLSIKKLLLISLVAGTFLIRCKATTNNNNQQGDIGAVRFVVGTELGAGASILVQNLLGRGALGRVLGFAITAVAGLAVVVIEQMKQKK